MKGSDNMIKQMGAAIKSKVNVMAVSQFAQFTPYFDDFKKQENLFNLELVDPPAIWEREAQATIEAEDKASKDSSKKKPDGGCFSFEILNNLSKSNEQMALLKSKLNKQQEWLVGFFKPKGLEFAKIKFLKSNLQFL